MMTTFSHNRRVHDQGSFSGLPYWMAGFICLSGLLVASDLKADSDKLKWSVNNHFYQRFDVLHPSWNESQKHCEESGGHLATITSEQENMFITTNLVTESFIGKKYILGANDIDQEGVWKWVTGEAWGYSAFAALQPSNEEGENYLALYGLDESWYDMVDVAKASGGFVCEWSYNNFVASAAIPDINNNHKSEIAVLYVDYKTNKQTVKITDSSTRKLLKTLTFGTYDHPPLGIVGLADNNGNGKPEIAILYVDVAGAAHVAIKDAFSQADLKDFVVLKSNFAYVAKTITASPDLNGNLSSEINVLGMNAAGKGRSETRDSKTGALLGFASY